MWAPERMCFFFNETLIGLKQASMFEYVLIHIIKTKLKYQLCKQK